MEIRLHALHGMHFIIYHYDHPIQTRSFSSAHKNTKTIAQLYKNVHWPWRAFSKKCVFGSLCTDAPSTKKNGEIDSLSLPDSSVSVTDVSTGYMWKVGQIGQNTTVYKQKRIREEGAEYTCMRLYCSLWTTPTPAAQLFLFCRLSKTSQLKLAY